MKISAYSACQRRAINQVWTVCGDYGFEPQFLAMRSDGQPDLYMNCIIGLVHKWFGDDMPKKLFASWAGDARQAMYDDLAVGAAMQNLLIRAAELGLGTLWIGNTGYAYEELIRFVGTEHRLVGAVALGWPDEAPKARPRKPLADVMEWREE